MQILMNVAQKSTNEAQAESSGCGGAFNHEWASFLEVIKNGTIIDRKNVSPCNHLDIGALRLPLTVSSESDAGDWLIPN